jgi:hypothetical protein
VFDLSLDQLLIRAGACVIIVTIHGAALAAIARALGDRGPQFDERLTLNPVSHLDILGAARPPSLRCMLPDRSSTKASATRGASRGTRLDSGETRSSGVS